MGRAFCAISAGRFGDAVRYHLFGIPIYGALAWILVKHMAELALKRPLAPLVRSPWRERIFWLVLGGWLLWWVAALIAGTGPVV